MSLRTFLAILMTVASFSAATRQVAEASAAAGPGSGTGLRYEKCLELNKRKPLEGLAAAKAWEASGGGPAAAHCEAVALVALKRYAEAAVQLDRMGHENLGQLEQRANLFDQAGNAWLLARDGEHAFASFSSALALSPRETDYLADRARASALLGDWKAAEADLSAALRIDSSRADLLVLRASARHAFGKKREAATDVEAALRIVPNYPEALLERGALELESGNRTAATRDWQAVLAHDPKSGSAVTARERLGAMSRQDSR